MSGRNEIYGVTKRGLRSNLRQDNEKAMLHAGFLFAQRNSQDPFNSPIRVTNSRDLRDPNEKFAKNAVRVLVFFAKLFHDFS